MRYASVCSGVEAPSVAWDELGWKPVWFSQFDPEHNYKNGPDFPSEVLAHHYPDTPNLGDMTQLREKNEYRQSSFDVLIGGTPCQPFSVAGLREGLGDERGNLALEFCKILNEKKPKWFIWENVPGVLSSNKGEDFKSIIRAFTEVGYGVSWRVLDAQFFGVPQRRRRVFVVGYLGDWRPSSQVLFEPESLLRNTKKSRKAKSKYSRDTKNGSSISIRTAEAGSNGKRINALFVQNSRDEVRWQSGDGQTSGALSAQPGAKQRDYLIAGPIMARDFKGARIDGIGKESYSNFIEDKNLKVRKLTPIEYERLQGFPDNYTKIAFKNKSIDDCPDGHRYKAMGNSMAVPVIRWLGERIDFYDKLI